MGDLEKGRLTQREDKGKQSINIIQWTSNVWSFGIKAVSFIANNLTNKAHNLGGGHMLTCAPENRWVYSWVED